MKTVPTKMKNGNGKSNIAFPIALKLIKKAHGGKWRHYDVSEEFLRKNYEYICILSTRSMKRKKSINYVQRYFRVLRDNGIEAVVVIELTRGKDGKPNGRVHFHILTDDPRSEDELRELFNGACERQGLVRDTDRIAWHADHLVWDEDYLVGNNDADFRVDYRDLWDGYRYFAYFTKCGYEDKVILFQKDLRMQKFYYLGWGFETGEKKRLWKEFLAEKYGRNFSEKEENKVVDEVFEEMKKILETEAQ